MIADSPKDLVLYNSDYLSTLICFPDNITPPLYLTPGEKRRPNVTRDSSDCSYFYQTLQWFIGLDKKRITIIVNGNSDVYLHYKWSREEIELLRRYPIAIYMYEPLFLRHTSDEYPFVQPNYNPSIPTERPVSEEFHWVQDFINKFKLRQTVHVYLCDYNLKLRDIHRQERFKFKVETFDIFLLWASCRLITDSLTCPLVNKWRGEIYPYPQLTKKAVCLNYRWEAFRELVTIHLRSRADYQEIHLSYFHYHDRKVFLKKLGFNPFSWTKGETYEKTLEQLQTQLPLVLEVQAPTKAFDPLTSPIPDFDGIHNKRISANDYLLYTDSFLSIVSESRCITAFPCISEKTLKPMLMKRPFVLLAGPHALKYLKELGFKTFGDFWDESYDEIEEHEQRLSAAFQTIDSILDKPLEDLKKILLQMESILHHNHVHATYGLPQYYKNKLEATLLEIHSPPINYTDAFKNENTVLE